MCLFKRLTIACGVAASLLGNAHAQEGGAKPIKEHYWLETSVMGDKDDGIALGLHFNIHTDNHSWTIGYRALDQDFIFGSRDDKSTGAGIEGQIRELSVAKLWHWPFKYGYASLSAGGSLLKGDWGTNCGERISQFIGWRRECDRNEFTTIGIPLRATASFGRYVGIGFSAEVNINAEEPYVLLGINIPIGGFAR
jgi:hypothetical protein